MPGPTITGTRYRQEECKLGQEKQPHPGNGREGLPHRRRKERAASVSDSLLAWADCVPANPHTDVSTPGTSGCDLFGNKVFKEVSKLKCGEGNGTPLQCSCLENPMEGAAWWAAVRGVAKSRTRLSDLTLTFHFHALEKEMATHSSVLAWRIPGTGEPGGLLSMGSHRVGHD